MTPKHVLRTITFILLSAILTLAPLVPSSGTMYAASPQAQMITGDVTWDSDQDLGTDVVVGSGGTLTIASGVTVTADASQPDPSPSADGLSDKIEIIVKSGGRLDVQSGVTLTAITSGDWYGLVYLDGSAGEVISATISKGIVGISVINTSITIRRNTIQLMHGDNGEGPGDHADEITAGIMITGTGTTQVVSNTISHVLGGTGMYGADGANGGVAGIGGSGGAGGNGGDAFGILVQMDATPTLRGNKIDNIWGGLGSNGGDGGDGGAGWSIATQGGKGGSGGNGGRGGIAAGILVQVLSSGWSIEHNKITNVYGGYGGYGGLGGAGGVGYDGGTHEFSGEGLAGGAGGAGGDGGSAGSGGDVWGINVGGNNLRVYANLIDQAISGGGAGIGRDGGAGGLGGEGGSPSEGKTGGNGGQGGVGGEGGEGDDGGDATGLAVTDLQNALTFNAAVSSTAIISNTIRARVRSGEGGIGGLGGVGGAGGDGGNGHLAGSSKSDGGNGGNGGVGGLGGDGYPSGSAYGMHCVAQVTMILARNVVDWVDATSPSGYGGDGGTGGGGGDGGLGGTGAIPGDGGNGGTGGTGAGGGDGGYGGFAAGVQQIGETRFENNLIHTIQGGDGANGGLGGNGGNGGVAGTGATDGQPGAGGNGGTGGDGNDTGFGVGMMLLTLDSGESTEVVNNTIANIDPGYVVGLGGSGGTGGAGSMTNGAPGSNGDYEIGVGIYPLVQEVVMVNNIIAQTPKGLQASNAPAYYGIYTSVPITATLDYNNLSGWGTNYHGVTPGPNDISAAPLFVNSTLNDYHLESNSPCIDKGASTFPNLTLPDDDFDGETRPFGTKHDIGADEWLPCTPLTGAFITGPRTGKVGTTYTFEANIWPENASLPVQYTWAPAPASGQGTSKAVYTWQTTGVYSITLSIKNCGGTGGDLHTITIGTGFDLYLPMVLGITAKP